MPTQTDSFQIIPSGAALGAEIRGVDLTQPLPPDVVERIRQALFDHCVLVFRGRQLSEQDQVRFTNYFGKAIQHLRGVEQAVKEIFVISNVEENGKPIGLLGNYEVDYHTDLSYMHMPATLGTLYGVEVTQTGGNTVFCNCYTSYETLDEPLKARLKGLRAVHKHPRGQGPTDPAVHPIVCTHYKTGRKFLFISPLFTKYVVDMPETESAELLKTLFTHMLQPRMLWSHKWAAADLVMWDNFSTIHCREPFPNSERRIVRRTQVYNETRPVE